MDSILVSAIGSFSADIVIKTLQRLGKRVVGIDIYPAEWIADSLSVDVFYQAPYASEPETYRSFIQEVCEREHVSCIIPLTDVEVDLFNSVRKSASNESWLQKIKLLISPTSALAYCRNKARMAQFLSNSHAGIQGIETRLLADCPREWDGKPQVVKPLDGRSSQGLIRVYANSDWQRAWDQSNPQRTIVQPLIEGPVITVDVVRDQHGHCVAIPREELLRTLNGAGTSVRVFADAALQKACCKLAEELGVLGCVNFEFIREEKDSYRFLECNPRFSGGVEFSCIAGYDCVANHLAAFEGKEIEPQPSIKETFIARKYEEYVTATSE